MMPMPPLLKKGMFGFLVLFNDAHPMLSTESPAKTSLVRISKSTKGCTPRTLDSSQAPVVKSEPLDEDEVLQNLNSSSMKKGKQNPAIRFSSPVVISSDESEAPTPKAKLVKSDIVSSDKLKKMYVLFVLSIAFCYLISEVSAPSTPSAKGKGKSAKRLSSPLVISSGESDAPVHKAKPVKGDNPFSSNKHKNL